MNWATVTGVTATLLGIAGYVAGIYVAYPGRALSLTLLMVGVSLAAVGHTEAEPVA